MRVRMRRDIHGGLLEAGGIYRAEPFFYELEQRVKVYLPGSSDVCVIVDWDDFDVVD